MLRLITKESPLYRHELFDKVQKSMSASTQSPHNSFLWDFQEISWGIFILRVQDTFHELACEFTLELKESFVPSGGENEEGFIKPVLVAHFPSIDSQRFQQRILWDEYLHGMIFITFQLNILEKLLLFCESKHAAYLFLSFHETNLDYLEIFQRFIISQEEVFSAEGELLEIAIPSSVSVYDDLIDLMEEIDHKFRQTLWREQRTNPTYRQYLKSGVLI